MTKSISCSDACRPLGLQLQKQ